MFKLTYRKEYGKRKHFKFFNNLKLSSNVIALRTFPQNDLTLISSFIFPQHNTDEKLKAQRN